LGVTEQQLIDLGRYQTSAAFDEVERLVLDLAVAMARTPAAVPRELFGRLREVFDEAQLVELAGTIAWENWRSRFNRVFDVQPAGFTEGAFCALPERPF
jgi:alkylhydroperoxidase family enzyme